MCLARFLAGLPDPRNRRGRRFPLTAIVTAAAAGVLAGARSLTAIAEWMADAPRRVLLALGFAFDPFSKAVTVPHPTTVMRLLTRLDGDALDAAVSAFLQARAADRSTAKARWRAIAVDGKQLRGSRAAGGAAVWLLAAMDHTGTVLAQRQVDTKSEAADTGPSPVDRRKTGSKHHLICDGRGTPLKVITTAANVNDVTQALALVDGVPPVADRPGRPRRRPEALLEDNGYGSILPVISRWQPEHQGPRQAPLRRQADLRPAPPVQAHRRPLVAPHGTSRRLRLPRLQPHLLEAPQEGQLVIVLQVRRRGTGASIGAWCRRVAVRRSRSR
ncbi:transposase family protein [Streptomyces ardesiacus]